MSQAVKPVRGSTEQPDHIMLSIKGDAATSMTVTWRTCTDIKEGYVLYREDGSSEVMRADAATEVFKSDIDISNMFWADLTGLKPDTKYLYTCGSDNHRSEKFYFQPRQKISRNSNFSAYRISRRASRLTARTIRISTALSKRRSKRTQTRASF